MLQRQILEATGNITELERQAVNHDNQNDNQTQNVLLDFYDEPFVDSNAFDTLEYESRTEEATTTFMYRTFPSWHAPGSMYGTSVQVHFVKNVSSSVSPTAVIIFTKTTEDECNVYGCCLDENCDRLGTPLAQYAVAYGVEDDEIPRPFPSCQHMADAAMCILHSGDVDTSGVNADSLKTLLRDEMSHDQADLPGIYPSAQIYDKHGRPVLLIDSSYNAYMLYYSQMGWWCPTCQRGIRKPCIHIMNGLEIIQSGFYDDIVNDISVTTTPALINGHTGRDENDMSSQNAVANDFHSTYVLGTESVSRTSDLLVKIGRLRCTNLRFWLTSTFTICPETNLPIITPEKKNCDRCRQVLELKRVDGHAFLFSVSYEAIIMYCGSCENQDCELYHHIVNYDGYRDGICNYKNKTLIPHENVFSYLRQFAKSGTAVTAWWDECAEFNWKMSLSNIQHLSLQQIADRRGQVATAIAGCLEKVDFTSSFHCCAQPKVVSMDGIVLSVTRKSMPHFTRPWMLPSNEISRGSLRKQRQLPELSKEEREFLKTYMHPGCRMIDVVNTTSKTKNVALKLVCTLYKVIGDGSMCICDDTVKKFAKVLLSKVAPVTNLLPHDQLDSLRMLLNPEEVPTRENLRDIQENAPFLFAVYFTIQKHSNAELKLLQMELFARLLTIIEQCRSDTYMYDENGLYEDVNEDDWVEIKRQLHLQNPLNHDLDELWSTGVYFPHHRIQRRLRHIDITNRPPTNCVKLTVSDAAMMPGVLLFYCVEHEKCIGFVVLGNAEGPRVAYEILATRFVEPPDVVIYDNACNLSEYVLNRTPFLFRRTQFLVDEFHFKSHSICAPTFSTAQNPCVTLTLNTSLTEQRNAKLTRMKFVVPLMRSRLFFSLLRGVIAHTNDKSDEKRRNTRSKSLRNPTNVTGRVAPLQ